MTKIQKTTRSHDKFRNAWEILKEGHYHRSTIIEMGVDLFSRYVCQSHIHVDQLSKDLHFEMEDEISSDFLDKSYESCEFGMDSAMKFLVAYLDDSEGEVFHSSCVGIAMASACEIFFREIRNPKPHYVTGFHVHWQAYLDIARSFIEDLDDRLFGCEGCGLLGRKSC